MRSPVSPSAPGECNAIRDRGFGHVELTFASTLETEFVNRRYCRRFARLTGDRSSNCEDTGNFRMLTEAVCRRVCRI